MKPTVLKAAFAGVLLLVVSDLVLGDGRSSPLGSWSGSSSLVDANGKLASYSARLDLGPGAASGEADVDFTLSLPEGARHFATKGRLAGNVLTFDADWGNKGFLDALARDVGLARKTHLHALYTFTSDEQGETLQGWWTFGSEKGHEALRRRGTGWSEKPMGGSFDAEKAIFSDLEKRVNGLQDEVAKGGAEQRGFHNKGKGLKAEFRVNGSLASDLQVGFAKPGASYPAIVRFSNAGSKNASDAAPDERGLAIRVKTGQVVPLLSGAKADAQDFLTTNSDVTARDPVEFLNVATALGHAQEFKPGQLFALFKDLGIPEAAYATYKVALHTDFLKESYTDEKLWSSRAPIKWGQLAVKFQLTPAKGYKPSVLEKVEESVTIPESDHLSANLARRLKEGDVVLDFAIQRFESEKTTPIEDASIEWKTPVEPVGQLVLVKQDLDDAQAKALAAEIEKMAFNPWNCTEEFRPLGSIMRARRGVYAASAEHRGACPFGFGR